MVVQPLLQTEDTGIQFVFQIPNWDCKAFNSVSMSGPWFEVSRLQASSINCRFLGWTWCKLKQPGNYSCLWSFPPPSAGTRRDQIHSLLISCTSPCARACNSGAGCWVYSKSLWKKGRIHSDQLSSVCCILQLTEAGNQNPKGRYKVSTNNGQIKHYSLGAQGVGSAIPALPNVHFIKVKGCCCLLEQVKRFHHKRALM